MLKTLGGNSIWVIKNSGRPVISKLRTIIIYIDSADIGRSKIIKIATIEVIQKKTQKIKSVG